VKTHVIVQSLSVCLLLAWTVWDIPATDAGGPPIRLAVERQVTQFTDGLGNENPTATQLLPTEWDRSVQLIPTKIDDRDVRWVRQVVDSGNQSDNSLFNGKQVPWAEPPHFRAIETIVNEFLDGHFSQSPLSPNHVVLLSAEERAIAPWIVGEMPTYLMFGIETPVYVRLGLYHPGITPEYVTDRTWLPASQWWSRVLKPRKSTL
jgi:hypothetical protein